MRLVRLRIDRLPGLPRPFHLEPGPGVNLLLGPNASGKTSVARALTGLLWPAPGDGAGQILAAEFEDGGGVLAADRGGGPVVAWRRDGAPASAPEVPGDHLAACYRLGAQDLLGAGHEDLDRDLAADLRTSLAGGVDLDAVADAVGAPSTRQLAALVRAWDAARDAAHAVGLAQRDLARRHDGLAELERELADAEVAGREERLLAALQELRAARADLAETRAARASLPAAVARAREDDADVFAALQERIAQREARTRTLSERLTACERELERITPPQAGRLADTLPRLEARVRTCRETAQSAAAARATAAGADRAWREARAGLADGSPPPDAGDLPDDEAFADLAARHHAAARLVARREALAELEQELVPARPPRKAAAYACLGVGLLLVAAPVAAPDLPPSLVYPAAAVGLGVVAAGFALAVQVARRVLADALAALRARLDATPPPAGGPWTLGRRLDETGWVRDLDRLREATRRHGARTAARAAAEAADARLAAALAACAEVLAPWHEEPPADAAAADEALSLLRDRLVRHDRLRGQAADLRDELAAARRDQQGDAAQREALLRRLDLPADTVDPGPLRSLVEAIPARDRADEALLKAQQRVELLAEDAQDAGTLADLDDEALAARRRDAARRAGRARDLAERRAQLRFEVEAAREGHSREQALADVARARGDVADWRARARAQALESALLDEVREQHEADTTPAQLEHARALLETFTGRRYRLELAPARDGGTFRAHDRQEGREMALHELSDGTRAQLLLAVRLAFLEHAETTVHPPLLLDETLATADPARRDAVAGALGLLSRASGRQVFYLTSDPGDAAAWRRALADRDLPAPTVLDLAAARSLAAAATPRELAPPPVAPVPPPADHDAAAYGRLLGVARLDPHGPWEAVDTFHLVAPDLGMAHRLRVLGLTRAGLLDAALGEAPALLPPPQAGALERALRVLRAFLPAWREGRPRPALPADLAGCEALTDTMRPRVAKELATLGGDAAALVSALRDKAVARLRADAIDALEEHLERRGCLDARPALEGDALVARVQARLAGGQAKAHPPQEVRSLVQRLVQAVPAAVAAAPSTRRSSG